MNFQVNGVTELRDRVGGSLFDDVGEGFIGGDLPPNPNRTRIHAAPWFEGLWC